MLLFDKMLFIQNHGFSYFGWEKKYTHTRTHAHTHTIYFYNIFIESASYSTGESQE